MSMEMKTPLPFEIEKRQLAHREQNIYSVSANSDEAVCLTFANSRVVGVHAAEDTLYSLCLSEHTKEINCNGDL